MKKLLLLFPFVALSCKTASKCDAYSIRINPSCDSMMVERYNQMYMPKIPIEGASSICCHDIKRGSYRVKLYDNGNIETIKFKIK